MARHSPNQMRKDSDTPDLEGSGCVAWTSGTLAGGGHASLLVTVAPAPLAAAPAASLPPPSGANADLAVPPPVPAAPPAAAPAVAPAAVPPAPALSSWPRVALLAVSAASCAPVRAKQQVGASRGMSAPSCTSCSLGMQVAAAARTLLDLRHVPPLHFAYFAAWKQSRPCNSLITAVASELKHPFLVCSLLDPSWVVPLSVLAAPPILVYWIMDFIK